MSCSRAAAPTQTLVAKPWRPVHLVFKLFAIELNREPRPLKFSMNCEKLTTPHKPKLIPLLEGFALTLCTQRQAVQKLGMKQVPGIMRVTVKKSHPAKAEGVFGFRV